MNRPATSRSRADIPRLFEFNAFCVLSDGVDTLQGMYSLDYEWFTPWKSIDGRTVEPETTGSMKTLIEGLFPRWRLLDYVRHFIVHEVVNEQIAKKGAKYHQYFAVRFAVEKALEATHPDGDRRIGVVWHTQGAGKSLSMIFFVGILRRHPEMANPSFVIQVDRADLDNQLYSNLVAARSLVGTVHQARSIEDLRDLLQTEGGEVICSTIEKFQTRAAEGRHPVLSERRNIIVIADEAHRSQYGFLGGFAEHLRRALPNASFIGFTGTPIDKEDANPEDLLSLCYGTLAPDDETRDRFLTEEKKLSQAFSPSTGSEQRGWSNGLAEVNGGPASLRFG